MNKAHLLENILAQLETVYQVAKDAAQRAYDTATDEENEAENKYDTLGLEASYLAHGQAKRVAQCEADLIAFKKLKSKAFSATCQITLGALLCLEDEQGSLQYIFLSPVAGGLQIEFDNIEITLVTSSSPLGRVLLGCVWEDEVDIKIAGDTRHFVISKVL